MAAIRRACPGIAVGLSTAWRTPATPISQLWHEFGLGTWDLITAGAAAGHDVRIGFEDVLVLPDDSPAHGNEQLVAMAVDLTSRSILPSRCP